MFQRVSVTQISFSGDPALKHWWKYCKTLFNNWYNYILLYKRPTNIVVNGNNILEAKNSQRVCVTLWWPKQEMECSKGICSTFFYFFGFFSTWYVDWLILIWTFTQRHLWISFCDYTTSLPDHDKMLLLESYTAFYWRSQSFLSQF